MQSFHMIKITWADLTQRTLSQSENYLSALTSTSLYPLLRFKKPWMVFSAKWHLVLQYSHGHPSFSQQPLIHGYSECSQAARTIIVFNEWVTKVKALMKPSRTRRKLNADCDPTVQVGTDLALHLSALSWFLLFLLQAGDNFTAAYCLRAATVINDPPLPCCSLAASPC